MTTPLLLFVFAVALALQTEPAAGQFNDGSIKFHLVFSINGSIPITYETKVIESRKCQTAEEREEVQNETEEREEVQNEVHLEITMFPNGHTTTESPPTTYTCGGTSGWTRIAYLDMSNSSHQCPGDLREVSYEGIRLCARDSRSANSYRICTSVTIPTNGILYSTVCGRVVGYHYGDPEAFYSYTYRLGAVNTIDEYYVDGVTLTHGPVGAREHIWTFATGAVDGNRWPRYVCPCAPNAASSIMVPPYIGEDYFCESGTTNWQGSGVFYNEPLWDGDGCSEGNSCCTFNNPPYFTRQLPASTSDDIELRDCGYYRGIGGRGASDTLIQFIELYVK